MNQDAPVKSIRKHLPIIVLVTLFLGLSTYYNIVTPLWEAPDEPSHFNTIKYIVDNQTVAGPITQYKTSWHHPPLYYIISAIVISPIEMSDYIEWRRPNPKSFIIDQTNPVDGPPNFQIHHVREQWPYQDLPLAVHVARGLNAIFGAITVIATYTLSRKIFPEQRWFALGTASIVAFNPEFLFFSGSVNNEIALAAGFGLSLLPLVSILQGDHRQRTFMIAGVLIALAVLVKQSGLALVGVAGITILITAWQTHQWKRFPVWAAWMTLPFVVITGPYYLRNQLLYGDPFGYAVYESRHPPVAPKPFAEVINARFFERMHESFWGYFGWLNVPYPEIIYTALWVIYPITLLGLCIWFWQAWQKNRAVIPIIIILLFGILGAWAFPIRHSLRFGAFGVQGRYLFQMLPALATVIAVGFSSLLPEKWRSVPLIVLAVSLFGLAVWTPGGLLKPTYSYVGNTTDVLESLPFQRSDVFAGAIGLAGYTPWLEAEEGPLTIQLYWHTKATPLTDYTVFAHLVGGEGNMIGQHDRRPLDGGFPTHLWRAGDVMHTTHTIPFDPVCRNQGCYLVVGFYDWKNGERLPVTAGQPFGDAVKLDEFFPYLGVVK
ncbi:MAG: phospholipid carrier-dependent glycosyltransferase [Chloroflexota bacterium]